MTTDFENGLGKWSKYYVIAYQIVHFVDIRSHPGRYRFSYAFPK